jgi:maltose phosphorylase
LFEDHFDLETIRENFDFYEPKTVHESSLSPCVHAIIAAKIGRLDKAYELYLRTSRLDLDDYNHEADEGLHITSMAGTWLSMVEGFAGIRIAEEVLIVNPLIPSSWTNYRFQILFKNNPIIISISKDQILIENKGDQSVNIELNGNLREIEPSNKIDLILT